MMYVKAPFIYPLFLQLSSVSAHLEMDEDSPWDNINVRSLGMKLLWCWGGRHHVVREDQRPKPSDSRGWISLVLSLIGLAAAVHWIPRNPGSGNQLFRTGSMFEGKRKTSDHFHRACMSSLKLSNQTGFFLLTTRPSPASPPPSPSPDRKTQVSCCGTVQWRGKKPEPILTLDSEFYGFEFDCYWFSKWAGPGGVPGGRCFIPSSLEFHVAFFVYFWELLSLRASPGNCTETQSM